MKKALAILLSVLLLMTAVPFGAVSVSAATSGITGDCTWKLDGTRLTISGNGAMANYHNDAPWGANVTSVIIEKGVTHIGDEAFYACTSLASITIPNTVKSIGSCAFYSCTSLTSLTIPDSMTVLGWRTFLYCTSLKTVVLPKSITAIMIDAFLGCEALTDVYYGGTMEDKGTIYMESESGYTGNDFLRDAVWHYGYVPEPETDLGDANGDGEINNRDLGLFQQYLNDFDVTVDVTAADFNGDGKLNNRDLGLLQQYLNA